MKTTVCVSVTALTLALSITGAQPAAQGKPPEGFVSLFNGKDLTGWKIPEGDGGHWKVVDGVIDYDAGSQAATDKNLWTEKSFKNFQLKIDWRIKETPFISKNMKIVMPDGRNKRDASGLRSIWSRRIQIPDCCRAARAAHSSTSGAGRWDRARCTATGPIRKRRRPSRRP